MAASEVQGHLDGMVLAVLARRSGHGYAVAEELRRSSGGVFDLPEGTVYPALYRLERAGLLSSAWERHLGRKRRVYAVTSAGREALGQRQSAWQRFAAAVDAVFTGAPSTGAAR
jgi:PadR family transcriptional regulator PadR